MAETQEGLAAEVSDSSQKLHADVGQAFLNIHRPIHGVSRLYRTLFRLFTDEERRDAFTETAAISKQYTDALIERWIKEIDTYLVYAGLFSAILTAFNVESYQLLQPASPDPSPPILKHISLQLSSLSYVPPFINSTHPPFSSSGANPTTPSVIPTWAIWLNVFWFSGLVLSLSAASIGILVKQWINEFQSGLFGDSEHIARLRQYRLNNLERCHVGSIVNLIPVLLQGALALFLAGLLALLWNLHRAVAAVTSLFVLAIAVFIVGTTIAPLLTERCAYLSPQSLMVYTLWPYVPHITRKMLSATKTWLFRTCAKARALAGLPSTTTNREVSTEPSVPHQSWVARERATVRAQSRAIERDMCITAYEATLDSNVISSDAACIVGWEPRAALQWFGRLFEIDTFHFGKLQGHYQYSGQDLHAMIIYGYILLCVIMEERASNMRVLTNPGFSREGLEEQFLHLLPRLQHRSPASSDDGPFSWGEKVAWILGAHATLALYAAEAEHNSHDQPFSPSRIGPERWHGKELEPSQLYSMARIVDIGAFPARHQSVLISSKGIHVAFAFRTLQTSGYALDKPFEHLGAYLRAHAILLHAVAIHSCQLGISNSLQKGMKIALSDLSATFDNLSRSFRNDAPTDTKRHIFCPVVHIVHALSHELDFFQPLVPPDFWDNLDTLFSAFKQSGVSRYWLLVTVPCKKGYWEPSDLYDNAQALITKGRNSAGQTDKTHTIQQSGLRDNLPAEASTPSPPQCHGEEIPRPSDALITTVTTPPRTQTDPDASHRHSSDSYQTDPWMYYYGNDFPEI